MKNHPVNLLITLILLFVSIIMYPIAATAGMNVDTEAPSRFIERGDEGWFFYEPIPEEEEPEEKKPLPVVQAPPPKKAEPAPSSPEGPQVFSTAWVRENLPRYLDAAWDNPTIENVRAYLYMQRFAIDRSEQFSDAAAMAVIGDPYLDEISRRPVASFAGHKVDRKAGYIRGDLINKLAKKYGIFFFFKSNCDFCAVQAPIVKMLERVNGYTVVPVSVDGKPYLRQQFPKPKIDNGHAKKLGIVTYPAMFLVSSEGEFEPVGQGVMSLPELKNRILIAAKRKGWVSEIEYNKTRPAMNMETNIAGFLTTPDKKSALKALTKAGKGENNFVPPEKMMQFIQSKLKEK